MSAHKTHRKLGSIQKSLLIWLMCLTIPPLVLTTTLMVHERYHQVIEREQDKLNAIRDLKALQIENWLDQRIGDLSTIAGDYELRTLDEEFNLMQWSPQQMENLETVRRLISRYTRNYRGYQTLFILSAASGRVIVSTQQDLLLQSHASHTAFTSIMQGNSLFIGDIGLYHGSSTPSMLFSVPVRSLSTNAIIGVLVAEVDVEKNLYSMLSNRIGLGATGESYILNKEMISLSPLLWHEQAPLRFSMKTEQSERARQGYHGSIVAEDYRGKQVITSFTSIPRTGWALLVEQDVDEIMAPLWQSMRYYYILVSIILALIVGLSIAFSRLITRPLLELVDLAQQLEKGHWDVQANFRSFDEVVALGQSFNNMARQIATSIHQQQVGSNVDRTILGAANIDEFTSSVTNMIAQTCHSVMAAFYVLDSTQDGYRCLYSFGANSNLQQILPADNLYGIIQEAVSLQQIVFIDTPEDELCSFGTLVGTITPRGLAAVPIVIEDSVFAVLFLASIEPFSQDVVAMIERVKPSLSMGLQTLLSEDHIRKLLHEVSGKNEELQSQTEELHAQTEELNAQSEELHLRNLELERERRHVEEANRLKSEFLSNMSHELRTPLNSIMALSKVLEAQLAGQLNDDQKEYLEVIVRNGHNLLHLINDILDLSKIEAGRMELNVSDVRLNGLIQSVADTLHQQAVNKGIALHCNLPGDLPVIRSDEKRLRHIVTNLASNAVKFTLQGEVSISAGQDEQGIWLRVKDTGVGIPQDQLPYIFDEFRQVDGSSTRQFEGTGLGLAIVRKSLQQLQGNIQVQSQVGAGTTFTVHLPLRIGADQPAREPDDVVVANGPLVLVVDDDEATCCLIADALQDNGYRTQCAHSGEDALIMASKLQPFAITLDILMPGIDGFEVLRSLKESPRTANIPVLMVTISKEHQTCISLGAVGVVTKPVDRVKLLSEIDKLHTGTHPVVMVVDDNDLDRRMLMNTLQEAGYGVFEASNGEEALRKAKRLPPDLLIIDLLMPVMNGFELVRQLHQTESLRHIPILVYTAKDLTREEKARLTGNVRHVLQKGEEPVDAMLKHLHTHLHNLSTKPAPADEAQSDGAPYILVVDDNGPAREQLKLHLGEAGYRVGVATDGDDALKQVEQEIPDGIILDLAMPDVDGFTTLERLREEEATRQIPVLILTARDVTRQELRRLRANHISQLVHKGAVEKKNLLHHIRTMLYRAKPIVKPKPEKERATLLIIEDNPDNVTTLRAILAGRYDLLVATSGEAGVQMAQEENVDLVLMDISLPGMDGSTVLRMLRQHERTHDLPVIATTAHAMKGDRERLLEAGFDDYQEKPVDAEELMNKLQKFLGK